MADGFHANGRAEELSGRVGCAQQCEFAHAFGIDLPAGYLGGSAPSTLALVLEKGQRMTYEISSELRGLGLSVPALGWEKPRGQGGSLTIAGYLTDRLAWIALP